MDIFASKLFKSSSRQDKIRAAAADPINVELVKQITDYVDPEYKMETEQGQDIKNDEADKEMKEAQEEFAETLDSEGAESEFSSSPTGHVSHMSNGTGANGHFDKSETDEPAVQEFDSNPNSEPDSEPIKDEVSESTDIMGEENDLQQIDTEAIKVSLEDDPETSGVARIQIKNDSELWVYYNDRINLNSIMENVISKVSSYQSLEFNRLARTDNAIVFEIN